MLELLRHCWRQWPNDLMAVLRTRLLISNWCRHLRTRRLPLRPILQQPRLCQDNPQENPSVLRCAENCAGLVAYWAAAFLWQHEFSSWNLLQKALALLRPFRPWNRVRYQSICCLQLTGHRKLCLLHHQHQHLICITKKMRCHFFNQSVLNGLGKQRIKLQNSTKQ